MPRQEAISIPPPRANHYLKPSAERPKFGLNARAWFTQNTCSPGMLIYCPLR